MNKKIGFWILAAALGGGALGVLVAPALSHSTPQVAYAAPGDQGQPMGPQGGMRPMGGPGGMGPMGGRGMGGPGMGGPPAFPMTANSTSVYILIGNTLYQYDAKTLKLLSKTQIEMPQPQPGMGGPGMGGPPGGQ